MSRSKRSTPATEEYSRLRFIYQVFVSHFFCSIRPRFALRVLIVATCVCVCVVCVLKPLFLSFFCMNIYLFCAKFMGDILVFRVFLSFIDMKNAVGFLFVSPHVCVCGDRVEIVFAVLAIN